MSLRIPRWGPLSAHKMPFLQLNTYGFSSAYGYSTLYSSTPLLPPCSGTSALPSSSFLRRVHEKKCEKAEEARIEHLRQVVSNRRCIWVMSRKQKSLKQNEKRNTAVKDSEGNGKRTNGFLENQSRVGAQRLCVHDIMHLFWLSAVAWAWARQAWAEKWKMERKLSLGLIWKQLGEWCHRLIPENTKWDVEIQAGWKNTKGFVWGLKQKKRSAIKQIHLKPQKQWGFLYRRCSEDLAADT